MLLYTCEKSIGLMERGKGIKIFKSVGFNILIYAKVD
nr:MAG TPA: hypothetical protein [Caudoviricetes sp.]